MSYNPATQGKYKIEGYGKHRKMYSPVKLMTARQYEAARRREERARRDRRNPS